MFVDVYAPAEYNTTVANGSVPVSISVDTAFPYGTGIKVAVISSAPGSASFDVSLRLPTWAAIPSIAILLNGSPFITGAPGTYVHITRVWGANDVLQFDVPMAIEAHEYTGVTQLPPFKRYAYTYGPILLAVTAPANWNATIGTIHLPAILGSAPNTWVVPANDGNPLHWAITSVAGALLQPSWEIDAPHARFSVYPAFDL